jgi:uncharacterized protein
MKLRISSNLLPRAFCALLIGLMFHAFPSGMASALDVPVLKARVTDLAGVLTPDQTAGLESKLKQLESSDSTQLAVLIIPSLEAEVLEDYSERVATSWRLGQKGRDNGALLLIAMKERQVRIEVGYGLEPTLTDARSRRIIQNEIVPHFRQGDFYEGIDAAATAIIQVVRGVYEGPVRQPSGSGGRSGSRAFDWLIILLLPMFWFLSATGRVGGAILGSGAGMFLVYSLAGALLTPILLGGLFGGGLGLFLGSLVRAGTRTPAHRRFGGFNLPFPPGSHRGGGGFFGGGFSGGGFSGGGGSFGGGGSSGSW